MMFLSKVKINKIKAKKLHSNYLVTIVTVRVHMPQVRLCGSLRVLKTVFYDSHLSYGAKLWGHTTFCNILFILQKQCIKIVCGLP